MTIAEAKVLYVEGEESHDPYWDSLSVPDIQVGDIVLSPSIGSKKGVDKITLARMFETFGIGSSRSGAMSSDYDTLRSALIQKYGQPNSEERRVEYGDPVRLAIWNFSSTTITLRISSKALINAGTISIDYRANDKKALEVL